MLIPHCADRFGRLAALRRWYQRPACTGYYGVCCVHSAPSVLADLFSAAPLEPIGLFGFAWTSLGPPQVHWIAPMIFSVLIAIANVRLYFP